MRCTRRLCVALFLVGCGGPAVVETRPVVDVVGDVDGRTPMFVGAGWAWERPRADNGALGVDYYELHLVLTNADGPSDSPRDTSSDAAARHCSASCIGRLVHITLFGVERAKRSKRRVPIQRRMLSTIRQRHSWSLDRSEVLMNRQRRLWVNIVSNGASFELAVDDGSDGATEPRCWRLLGWTL